MSKLARATVLIAVVVLSSARGTLAARAAEPEGRVLVEFGSAGWQYLDSGDSPAEGWKDADFSAKGWSTGQALLGYGDEAVATVVSFGDNAERKHRVTYVRKTFDLDSKRGIEACGARLIVDDAAVIYLNGKEVIRKNLDQGEVNGDTLSISAVADDAERYKWSFLIDAKALVEGKNVIAASVHQCDDRSTDLAFDLELRGLNAKEADAFNAFFVAPDVERLVDQVNLEEEQQVRLQLLQVQQPAITAYHFPDGEVSYHLADGRQMTQRSDAAEQVNQLFPFIRFARAMSGDTIEKIAVQHNLDAELLRKINRVAAGHVYREDELVCVRWWHRVLEGETLESIAKLYAMDITILASINGLPDEGKLREGQILNVAARFDHQLARNNRNAQGHLMVNLVQSQINRQQNVQPVRHRARQVHHVAEGESLDTIAKRSKVSPEFLRRLNRMEIDEDLRPGDVILIRNPVRFGNGVLLEDVLFWHGLSVQELAETNGLASPADLDLTKDIQLPTRLQRPAEQTTEFLEGHVTW